MALTKGFKIHTRENAFKIIKFIKINGIVDTQQQLSDRSTATIHLTKKSSILIVVVTKVRGKTFFLFLHLWKIRKKPRGLLSEEDVSTFWNQRICNMQPMQKKRPNIRTHNELWSNRRHDWSCKKVDQWRRWIIFKNILGSMFTPYNNYTKIK